VRCPHDSSSEAKDTGMGMPSKVHWAPVVAVGLLEVASARIEADQLESLQATDLRLLGKRNRTRAGGAGATTFDGNAETTLIRYSLAIRLDIRIKRFGRMDKETGTFSLFVVCRSGCNAIGSSRIIVPKRDGIYTIATSKRQVEHR
jgi:hypothetical protein